MARVRGGAGGRGGRAGGGAERALRGLNAYVEQGMRDWRVPGLAMAVVRNGQVVHARGYGVRTIGAAEPVDEHTSFAAASTTKAFTATALAILVDEGKLSWDDPVSRHLPTLRLADPGLASRLTIRDLLSHRTGLATHDELWYGSGYDSQEILRRLRFVRSTAEPRTRFQYSNNAYMLAGLVVQAASGMPWDQFVRTRILEPLGMRETLTGIAGLDTRGNVATPHLLVNDSVIPIPYRDFDNIGPAGSMNASVADMARWMIVQLDSGRMGDGRLVSAARHADMQTPQFIIPAQSYYPAARLARATFTAYGLGWFLQDYRGRKVALHTGSIDGMSAILALVPDEDLGVVVLANLDHAELRHALMYRVIDAYLGGPPRDWSAELRPMYDTPAGAGRALERRRYRATGTTPSLPLEHYAGSYADPDSVFPQLTVRVENGALVVATGLFTATLEHWHHDVFLARSADRMWGENFLTFAIDPLGRAAWVLPDGGGRLERLPDPQALPRP